MSLVVSDLTVEIGGRRLLDGISFEVGRGERVPGNNQGVGHANGSFIFGQ